MDDRLQHSLKDKTILIIDDEPDIAQILEIRFEKSGAHIHLASSGEIGIEYLRSDKPVDLVLTDIRMPGYSGLDILRELKTRDCRYPRVVILTGYAEIPVPQLYSIGAEGYFSKPYRLNHIFEFCQRLMLEGNDRWALPLNGEPSKTLRAKFDSLQKGLSSGDLSIGRGGIFITTDNSAIKVDETVGIEIEFSSSQDPTLKGTGVVRWKIKPTPDEPQIRLGIEFLHLEDACRSIIAEKANHSSLIAYIPEE